MYQDVPLRKIASSNTTGTDNGKHKDCSPVLFGIFSNNMVSGFGT